MEEETVLGADDTEDSSFLPGVHVQHKKSNYKPYTFGTLRRHRKRAIIAGILIFLVILVAALIGAVARPRIFPPCSADYTITTTTTTQTTQTATVSSARPETATKALSTNGKPYPWKDIRLPRTILPDWYHIHLQPNLTESWFRGKIEMHLQVMVDTDFVIFHCRELNVTSHSLKYEDSSINNGIRITEVLEFAKFEQRYLKLDQALRRGDRIVLTVEFHGDLISKLTGLYKSSYRTKNNETRFMATTDFEPTDARAAFPCFDEPDMKANFSLTMVRDKHHISLFNMRLLRTIPHQGSELLEQDEFETSVKMSTYLVAFVVCDFANLTKSTDSGMEVRIFAPADIIHEGQFALDVAVKVLPYYEELFGIKYPLPKQDLIAIPDFNSGAMENWGLITYRTTSVLFDPDQSSFSSQQRVARTVAHELAHQWFGNLVTMKWWDDLWLNEGFASFVEYLGVDHVKPEWKLLDQFIVEDMLEALRLDSLRNSHPIQVPVHNPKQINEIFDAISYDKGSSILRMLRNFLGKGTFKAGLHGYLKENIFSNSETVNLWEALSRVSNDSHLNVTAVMDTWTQQMGYPLVSLTRTGNQIEVMQERFLSQKGETTDTVSSKFGYKWYIPLTYISSQNLVTPVSTWMNLSSATFTVPSQTTWIKANSGMYGLYRVNYDPGMWKQLIDVLHTNHTTFSPSDRAELIEDAFALAESGHLNVTTGLDLSRYLDKETEYTPWVMGLSHLGKIEIRLEDESVKADFKTYMLRLLQPIIKRLGWNNTSSHLDKYLREMVLKSAVSLGHEDTITEARRLFHGWMSNSENLKADLKSVVYKAGIRYGGEKEWKFCWERYQATNVASEKRLLLNSLHYTHDSHLLSRFLQYSLGPSKVRSQDVVDVIGDVAASSAGRVLAWRFLRQNWANIRKRIGHGAFAMTELIKKTASSFSSQFDYDEVKAFFTNRDVGSGERAVKQALESIQMNMDWLKSHEDTITQWLKQHRKEYLQSHHHHREGV